MDAAIRTNRGALPAGKAAGQVGGGLVVTSVGAGAAAPGTVVAATNTASDGPHGATLTQNIQQVSLTSPAPSDGSDGSTSLTFETAAQGGFFTNGAGIATGTFAGDVQVPAGVYSVAGTLQFFDFDNEFFDFDNVGT